MGVITAHAEELEPDQWPLNAASTSIEPAICSRNLHRQGFAPVSGIGTDVVRLVVHDAAGARSVISASGDERRQMQPP